MTAELLKNVAEYNTKIAEKTAEVHALQRKQALQAQNVNSLHLQHRDLVAANKMAEAEKLQLEAELIQQQNKQAVFVQRLALGSSITARIASDLKAAEMIAASELRRQQHRREQAAAAQAALISALKMKLRYEDRQASARSKIAEAREEMAALEAHQEEQKAAVATLDTEVTELQKANAAKLTTVEQLEAKLAPFLTRLDTIANERDTLHKGTTAAKQELAAQKAETEKIQAESNAVKAEISRMEMQMHQAQVMANAKAATERRAMATAAATGHRPTAAAAGPRPMGIGPPPPRGPPRPPPQHQQQQQNRGMMQTQLSYGGQQGQVQARPPLYQGQQQSQARPTSYQPSPTAQMTNGPRGAQMAPRPAAAVGTGAPVPSGFDYDESGMDADVDRGSAGNGQQAMMQRQPSGSSGKQSYQQQHGQRPTAGISVADIAAMDLQAFDSIYNSNSSSSGGGSNSNGGSGASAGLPNGHHSSNGGHGAGDGDDDAEMINSYDFEMQSDYSGVPAGVAVGTSGYSHNTTIAPSVPASDFDGQSVAGASTAATVGGAYNPYGGQQYQGYGQHMHQQQPMMMPPPQQQYQGYQQQQQQQSVDPRRAGMTTTMPPPPPAPRPAAAAINTMTGTSGLKPGISTMNAPPRGQAAPAFASPPARGPVGGQAGARPTSDINSGGYGATQYQNQNQPPRPSAAAAGTGGPAGGSQVKAPPPPHLQASKLGVHNHQQQYQQHQGQTNSGTVGQTRPLPIPSAAVGGPPRGPQLAPRPSAAYGAGQGQPMGLRAMPPPRPTTNVLGR